MTFATKIQSLNGAHTAGGSGNGQCAVDWARKRVFIGGGSYICRLGINSGLEQIYLAAANYTDAFMPPLGIDTDGNIHLSLSTSLYAGGTRKLSGDTLRTITTSAAYLQFGGANMACVKAGSQQFVIDTCTGSTIIGSLNNTPISKAGIYVTNLNWPNSNAQSVNCPGQDGSSVGFVLTSPANDITTKSATLHKVSCGIGATITVVKTYVPADFDATWTGIHGWGICVDQTDGHLLFVVGGQFGGSIRLAKLHKDSGAILWNVSISGVLPDYQFSQSRIRNQRLGILTASPNKVTIINTADGSTVDSYTTGLAGITVRGPQCWDDTISAFICNLAFTATTGSPTRLRATPSSYDGWFVLYAAAAISPPIPDSVPGGDEVEPYVPEVPDYTVRQLRLFPRPPFVEYRAGADGVSVFPVPFRIMEQADLRVEVNGVELTQADFTYTGRDSQMAGHDTGYIDLDTAAASCIVRIWCDRAPARTGDLVDDGFGKTETNSELETLWVLDRAQHLIQTRRTDDPQTGAIALPAAYAGIRKWVQGNCVVTRNGSDVIYNVHTSGSVLTGTGADSLAELVCVKKGVWFVRTKRGSWSLA